MKGMVNGVVRDQVLLVLQPLKTGNFALAILLFDGC